MNRHIKLIGIFLLLLGNVAYTAGLGGYVGNSLASVANESRQRELALMQFQQELRRVSNEAYWEGMREGLMPYELVIGAVTVGAAYCSYRVYKLFWKRLLGKRNANTPDKLEKLRTSDEFIKKASF